MSFTWLSANDFKAPYRGGDIKEICENALDYFSTLLDTFIAKLPEHRQPLEFNDWLAEDPSLPDKINLIFVNGYGEYNESRNHNPVVWPVFLGLSDAVQNGTCLKFCKELCEAWRPNFNEDGQCNDDPQLFQRILDYLTNYLQMFVTFADEDSLNLEFSPDWYCKHWWSELNLRMAKRYSGAIG